LDRQFQGAEILLAIHSEKEAGGGDFDEMEERDL
jgi:hypothetical protein